ncbi:hypothetical protein ACQKP8_26275 [Photobacterium alginatilyticum]|uniref:hypothetical protein n=1 Tax=Photobacterium alginatilyticum TaxID=1775171 RepID=UPI0040686E7E
MRYVTLALMLFSANLCAEDHLVVKQSDVTGVWRCAPDHEIVSTDALTIYHVNGLSSGFAKTSVYLSENNDHAQLNIYSNGNWHLDGNFLVDEIDEYNVEAKNQLGKKIAKKVAKEINAKDIRFSKSEILSIDSSKMKYRTEDGEKGSCSKLL